jgi:predicted DNA-binding transcriptional regulator AlpA
VDVYAALLTRKDICGWIKVSPKTLDKMVAAGDFPAPLTWGRHKGSTRWSRVRICEWMERGCPHLDQQPTPPKRRRRVKKVSEELVEA